MDEDIVVDAVVVVSSSGAATFACSPKSLRAFSAFWDADASSGSFIASREGTLASGAGGFWAGRLTATSCWQAGIKDSEKKKRMISDFFMVSPFIKECVAI